MTTPSQVSASQVNPQISTAANPVSSTALMRTSNNWIGKVASTSSYLGSAQFNSGTATVTVPSGTLYLDVMIWGGGGGSFRSGTTRSTGGGGAFIYARIPLNGATTFTYVVGAGGTAPSGSGELSRITVNGIQYTAGGGTGGTSTAFGAAGTLSYTGGEAYVIYGQEGFNGFRVIGGAASLAGGNAGGQDYGGGTSTTGGANIPGAGAPVIDSVAQAGARGEIYVKYEYEPAVSWSKFRWGINFPGWAVGDVFTLTPPEYIDSYYPTRIYQSRSSFLENDQGYAYIYTLARNVFANSSFTVFANGQLQYLASGSGVTDFRRTWLTSGASSDYTIRYNVSSGTLAASSLASSTDYVVSQNRTWSALSSGNVGNFVLGELIIKRSSDGAELFRRQIYLYTLGISEFTIPQ